MGSRLRVCVCVNRKKKMANHFTTSAQIFRRQLPRTHTFFRNFFVGFDVFQRRERVKRGTRKIIYVYCLHCTHVRKQKKKKCLRFSSLRLFASSFFVVCVCECDVQFQSHCKVCSPRGLCTFITFRGLSQCSAVCAVVICKYSAAQNRRIHTPNQPPT